MTIFKFTTKKREQNEPDAAPASTPASPAPGDTRSAEGSQPGKTMTQSEFFRGDEGMRRKRKEGPPASMKP